jgi:Protein of unknown function (DUF3237)
MDRRHLLVGLALPGFYGTARGADPATPAAARQPPAPRLEFAYDATVLLARDVAHGRTPLGARTRAPIVGGRFTGPRIAGTVLAGGADWQLERADGYLVLEADYFMEASDGTQIRVHNKGLWHSPTGNWPADYALTTPEFEVPIGPHDWLNRHVFVGTVGPVPGNDLAVRVTVYTVLPPDRRA